MKRLLTNDDIHAMSTKASLVPMDQELNVF